MKKLTKRQKRNLELIILAIVVLFTILLWGSIIIFPIKIFTVLMHEIFHGLSAFFSGGKIVSIEVNTMLGGECVTEGGAAFVIASAGYLGSLLIGSLLFISGYNKKVSLWVCTILSAILLLFTANYMKGIEGTISALSYSVLLYISPRYFNKTVHLYFMKIFGLISCLYVVIDMKEDLLTLNYRMTDAQMLTEITGVPAIIWGFVWIAISFVVIYFLFKQSYNKGITT